MTDKIKKLESLTEDVQPEFPTLSRGGYVEDTVDDWLSNHLREVNEIIKYQNYGVDVVDGLESELESANARIQELENDALVSQAGASSTEDVTALKEELAAAKARIHELENAPLGDFPSGESETVQASILLQHATQLGAQYIEQAKADGEQIRKDAENQLVELRGEIEELEAQRFATYRSLDDFFSQELAKLRENSLFADDADSDSTEADAEEESADEEAVAEEAVVVPALEEETPAAEVEAPELDEDDEDEALETSDLEEDDEDSEGVSK